MLSEILVDALRFVAPDDVTSMLLSSRRYSAVLQSVVARRTLRTVSIRPWGGNVMVVIGARTYSGSMTVTSVALSETDAVEEKLRVLLHGSITELFTLYCNAIQYGWFADTLDKVLEGVVVSQTLRLHLYMDVGLDNMYATVGQFRYVHVRMRQSVLQNWR